MAEESNTLKLYNSLRDNGYKLPEYDRFEGRLKDSAARETLYNTLRDNGVNDLPEFSVFETWLGYPMPEDLKEESSQLPTASEAQTVQQSPQNPAKQQTGFLGTFVGDVLERINTGGAELGAGIFGVLDKGAKGLEKLTGGLIQSKGAWRDVAERFKQDAAVSRANSNRYDGKSYSDLWKEGDYLGAIGDIALTGAESIPMSIAAAAASVANPAAGLVGIGGITASERYDELSEENPNMKEFPKIANAILTGVAEGGSEMLGAGATNLWMQGLYKTLGRERAEQAVKEGFMGKLRQHFKDFGIFYEPVVEGLEEVSSQLAQNVTDKITGAAPDKDISEGLMDSFIYGMGGGAYFSAAGVPGFIKQRVERRKALQAGKEMPESDYNSAYQSSEQSRQSLSDIDPNLAATIDRYVNDESSAGEVQSLFDGLDETVRPLAEAYYQTQLVMRGITEKNLDDAETEVQTFADRIAPFAVPQDDDRRLITTAHFSEGLTEKDVYVKTIEGDNAVIFNDDGSTRMVSVKRLQNIQEQDADDLIARYRENALDGKNTQMEFRLHHHPKTQPAQPGLVIFNGDKAYILQERDERGDWVAFPAVLDTETGQTTAKKGGEPSILTDAEVLELQDLMYAEQEPGNQANEEAEKTSGVLSETPNVSAKTPNVSDKTLGENPAESVSPEERLNALKESFPKTKDGTIDYKKLTPQQQYEYTSLADSPEVALEDIRRNIVAGNREIAALDRQLEKATGGKLTEIRDKMRSKREEVKGLKELYREVAPADAQDIDENGYPFMLSSDGTDVFGQITADTGLKEAPIKLSEGFNRKDGAGRNHGYGLAHIEESHGEQIRNAGFSSVNAFVESVAKNYETIRKGNNRDGNKTYLLEASDGKNNTLFVELSQDGSYWTVNSAGIFRSNYSKNKEIVWPLPAVEVSSTAEGTEVRNDNNRSNSMSGDSSQTISQDKGTVSSSENQAIPEENARPSADDMLDTLLDGSLSIEEVDAFVDANRKDVGKRLANIDKKKPVPGTNLAEYKRKRSEWQSRRDAVQHEADYWEDIDNRLRDSRRQPGDDAALNVLKNQTPQTGEELAAEMLADGSIKLLRDDFQRETGGGRGEARGLFGLFAGRDKGGMTIEQAGEALIQADLEQGTNLFDQSDPNAGRNAIIEVLSGARTRGDLINYVRRSREEQARRAAEAEYNEYAEWCEANFRMSPEDYEAYVEAMERDFRTKMQTPEAFDQVSGEIYGEMLAQQQEYADIDAALAQSNTTDNENIERNDEGGGNSLREGSDEVLPETQPRETGRTGETQGEREAGADARGEDGAAQEGTEGRIEPVGNGPFGPIYDQFRGDAQGAIRFLSEQQDGEAIAALNHPDVGDIDLVWGKPGTAKSNGYGLSKLVKFHPEVLDNLQDILNDMQVATRSDNRINLESPTHKAAVRLEWDGERKNWLLTAFEKETPTSIDRTTDIGENPMDLQNDTAPLQNVGVSSEGKGSNTSSENQTSAPDFIPGESEFDYAQRVVEANKRKAEERKVDTSPTEAQKEAGNYKKGHIKLDGFDITIENPKGSTRSGVDANGNPWSITMNNTYGYIRGTEGVDGDHIDVFLSDDPTQGDVFVIDQVKADGAFDEHKVMYGFKSALAAKRAYLANYSEGWQGLGTIARVSRDDFKKWVKSSHRKTKPFAEYKGVENKESSNPSGNRLVSDERYAELRRRMQEKLLGQMNMGIDPEILAIGTEMAVYHIEKGARQFANYARGMIADLGDAIRPYLKAFYNGARDLPEMSELSKEMDSYDDVSRFDVANFDKPVPNMMATAETVVEEQKVEKQAREARRKIKNSRKKTSANEDKDVPLSSNDLFTFNNNVNDGSGNQRTNPEVGEGAREEVERPQRRGNRGSLHGDNVPDADGSGRVPVSNGNVEPAVAPAPRNKNNFAFGDNHIDVPAGEVGKLKANIEAIRTLKEVEDSGKPATDEQKAKLARYVGWGGLSEALNEEKYNRRDNNWYKDRNWNDKYLPYYEELKGLLTEDEFRSALMSTTTSHYTPEPVIRSLWNIAQRLGFKGGYISEPAMGVGHILGLMPKDISDVSRISGYEIDSLSGRISKALYPDADVKVEGYETSFSPKSKDLVITNVPFGKDAPYDKALDRSLRKRLGASYNLHNYFIAKGLLELKDGGLGVFVTSSATMDGADSRFREFVQGNGFDLVGAIRLPNDAFLKNAGTSVTADILVFRRRMPGESSNGVNFVGTTQIGEGSYLENGEERTKPIMVNEYFAEHPGMMLGEMMTAHDAGSGGLYSGASQTLKARPGENLSEALNKAIDTLPKDVLNSRPAVSTVEPAQNTSAKDGTLSVQSGKVYVSMSGQLEPIAVKETFIYNGKEQKTADAVRSYNDLKDTLKELIAAEQSTNIDPEPLRKKLNRQYDAFVRNYGTLNRNKALDSVFAEDFEHNLPLSLESVQRVPSPTGKSMVYQVTKGQGILSKRVNFPTEEPAKAGSLQDAMNISRSYHGRIDVPYIAKLRNMSEEEVVDEMLREGVAYRDPITGDLVDKDTYLSGNVKEKLEEARTAAEKNPMFEKNVEDLAAVQPETIRFGDISYRLGTPWIPTEFVDQFASEVLGISDTWIRFVPQLNEFILDKSARIGDYAKSGAFETERLGAIDLFEAALNQRKPKVYDERTEYGPNGKTKVRILNEAETQAAAEKIMEISDRFVEYIDGKKAIHRELERIYNDRYNNYRLKEYGLPSFEHYPNSNHDITLRKHQMKAVQRSLGESTLLAHQVGTGKTFTMITTAMEMRRLGIAKKPMIVVQNATLEDFVKDFYKLYPGANVLAPGKDERSAENRKRLFNLIATGDFDAIVIPQSFMQFIPDDEGRKKALIQQRIDEFQRVIDATDDNTLKRRLQKEMDNLKDDFDGVEKSKKRSVKDKAKSASRMKSRLERQLDRRTDDVLTFEQMGIDALFIDEAHNFKKIGFPSKMSNVKGIDTGASQRANSLLLKAKWIQEKNGGRNVILATGTPITNTMAEVWTMMNFVSPDILEAYNIQNFDDFATTFGVVEPSLEFTATGNFKIADRFKSYVNVPELIKAFRSHTDVVLTTDVEEFKKAKNIPKLKDGQITNVVIDKNEDLQDVMDVLIKRLEEYNNMTGSQKREMSALPLVVFTKAKQAAIDLRLLNPTYPDNSNSKTNQVVSNIMKLYKESTPDKGTQLVFCDSYQSPGEMPKMDLFDYDPSVPRFNLYEDIKQKLVEQGIPASEIAIVNNYDGERRKALFEKVRNGDVRVLLGSTEKMGVGVNVQDRLYALHHIDAPLRPMDFEQRNGRILRQGNLYATWNKPVNVITYGVQGTLDATAYDRLRIKQDFINQMMKGNVEGRVMEEQDDEDPSGMSFSQMAATLSGDKTAQMLFIAQNKLKKLRNSKRSDANSKSGMSDTIENTKRLIRSQEGQKESLEKSKAIIDKYFPNGIEHIKIGKNSINEKFGTQLDPIITDYDEKYSLNRGIAPLKLSLNGGNAEAIVHFNEGRMVYDLFAGKEHLVENRQFNGGRGLMASLEHQLEAVDKNLNTLTGYIEANRKKIDGLTEAMNKPWGREDELKAAEKEVAELQRQLEEKAKDNPKPQEQKEELPEVRFRMKSMEELLDDINNNADEYREGNTAPQIPRPEAYRANPGIGPFEYPNDNLGRPEHAEPRGDQDARGREADGRPQPGIGRDDSQNGTDNGRGNTDARREDRRAGGRNHAAAGRAGEQPRREDRRGGQRGVVGNSEPQGDHRGAGGDYRQSGADDSGLGGAARQRRERYRRAAVETARRLGVRVRIVLRDNGQLIIDNGQLTVNSPLSIVNSETSHVSGETPNVFSETPSVSDKTWDEISGMYDVGSGEVYINLSNIRSEADAVRTVLHEVVGHKGLRELIGKEEYDTEMMRLYRLLPLDARREVSGRAVERYDGDFAVAMDEYLAEQAERDETPSWWQRVVSAVRDMLRRLGIDVELSDNDVKYLLWRSRKRLEAQDGFAVAEDVVMRRRLGVSGERTTRFRTASEESVLDDRNIDEYITEREVGSARDQYERSLSTTAYKFQEAFQDSMLSLKELMDAVAKATKSRILDYENAYIAENAMSSKNLAEMELFRRTIQKKLFDAITALRRKGTSFEEISDYLIAKHGIERNRYMAVKKALSQNEETYEERMQSYLSERDAIRANGKPWLEQQQELDALAEDYGVDLSEDFSGLSSMFPEEEGDGYSREEAMKAVADFERQYDTSGLWTSIAEANDMILSKQRDSGLMNKDTYDQIRGMYQFYVPLRGWEQTTADEVYAYLTSDSGAYNAPIKVAKGRKSKAESPIYNLINMAESGILQGNRNLMKQRFLTMAQNHKTDLVSISNLWVRKVETQDAEGNPVAEWHAVFPEIPDKATPEQVEAIVARFDKRMEELSKEKDATVKRSRDMKNIPYKILPRNLREHQVIVKRNGIEYVLTINGNPRAAQALNGLTNPDNATGWFGTMERGGKWLNRHLAANYTTRNPAFMISNFIRDAIYSNTMAWVKENPAYAWKFNRNFWRVNPARIFQLVRRYESGTADMNNPLDRAFREFMLGGGETGYTNLRDIETIKRDVRRELKYANERVSVGKAFNVLGKWFDLFNRSVENTSRFAAYLTSREMGRSLSRSVSDAKEVSVNFNKKGAGSKFLNTEGMGVIGNASALLSGAGQSLFVFWNAGVQGMYNFGKAGKEHKAKFAALGASAYLLGMLIPIVMRSIGGEDDDDNSGYYDLPEYVRRNNICFPNGAGGWITIPLPIELRAIYGLGELVSGVATGAERTSDWKLSMKVAEQMSQVLPLDMLGGGGTWAAFVPSSVKPIYEAAVNTDWTGLPIYKENDFNKYMPEWTKAYSSVDPILLEATKQANALTGGNKYKEGVVDLNPAIIEHVLQGYFGGIETMRSQLLKSAQTVIGDREFEWRNIPVANRVLRNGDERTRQKAVNDAYFTNLEEMDRLIQQERGFRKELASPKNGPFELAEYQKELNDLMRSEEYQNYLVFRDMNRLLQRMNEMFKSTGDEELEDEMFQLKAEMNEVVK